MATKKKAAPKKLARNLTEGPRGWENDDELYPRKRGICEFCGHKDDLKLSFDQIRYICLNPHACFLRWTRARNGEETT